MRAALAEACGTLRHCWTAQVKLQLTKAVSWSPAKQVSLTASKRRGTVQFQVLFTADWPQLAQRHAQPISQPERVTMFPCSRMWKSMSSSVWRTTASIARDWRTEIRIGDRIRQYVQDPAEFCWETASSPGEKSSSWMATTVCESPKWCTRRKFAPLWPIYAVAKAMYPNQHTGPAVVSAEALLRLELLLGERVVDLGAVSDIVTQDGGLKTHVLQLAHDSEPLDGIRPASTSTSWKSVLSVCASR